tara:strand:- start:1317 stop:2042 length:726 start_codon:yes stop_codon:yes gene_type:complete
MKVAILIPGLLRTYRQTYNNFFSNIIEPNKSKHEIHLFLAFWDHTHKRGELGVNEGIVKISKAEQEEVINLYNPKNYIVMDKYFEKNNEVFPIICNNLIEKIGSPNHPDGKRLIQNAVVAQYHSWSKCFSLINQSYDIVIKTRFDIITEEVHFDRFKNNHFNCSGPAHQYPQYELADVFFASNHNNMKMIMNKMYLDVVNGQFPNISNSYPNVFPEYILKDYLQRNDIEINYLNKKVYIVR